MTLYILERLHEDAAHAPFCMGAGQTLMGTFSVSTLEENLQLLLWDHVH